MGHGDDLIDAAFYQSPEYLREVTVGGQGLGPEV